MVPLRVQHDFPKIQVLLGSADFDLFSKQIRISWCRNIFRRVFNHLHRTERKQQIFDRSYQLINSQKGLSKSFHNTSLAADEEVKIAKHG